MDCQGRVDAICAEEPCSHGDAVIAIDLPEVILSLELPAVSPDLRLTEALFAPEGLSDRSTFDRGPELLDAHLSARIIPIV